MLVRTIASITKAEARALQTNIRKAPTTVRDLAAQWRRTRNDKYLVEITATARTAQMTTIDLIEKALDSNPSRM